MFVRGFCFGSLFLLSTAAVAGLSAREPFALATSPGDERAPVFSPDGAWIAFESNRSGNWDLWRVRPDGTDLENLTRSPSSERLPAYSPDGAVLAFQSDRDGTPELYRMPLAGGEPVRLTHQEGAELFPAWSPDGRSVAFTREVGGEFRLERVQLDGGAVTALLAEPGRDLWPRFAPDGGTIAFFSRRATGGADDEIHLLDLATGGVRRVTTRSGHDFCPAWFPDGRRLVVAHAPPEGARRLEVLDLEGRTLGTIGEGFERITEPAVSPDGKRIAFAARRSGEAAMELFTVELTEAAEPVLVPPVRLTESGGAMNGNAAFGPDGRLAFVSNRGGSWRVWVMSADGGDPRQLTHDRGTLGYASWSDDGEHLLFHREVEGVFRLFRVAVASGETTPVGFADAGRVHRLRPTTRNGQILFDRRPAAADERFFSLALAALDGSSERLLTSADGYHSDARLAPDGSRLVWQVGRGDSLGSLHYQIHTMNLDGSGHRVLTDGDHSSKYPKWSPDGRRIVFTVESRGAPGERDVWVMNADGAGKVPVTTRPGIDFDAVWSPDGNDLVYATDAFGGRELVRVRAPKPID